MYKLITFDGLSASGKFTNNVKLCEYLGIERLADSFFTLAKHVTGMNIYEDLCLRLMCWLNIVTFAYRFDWKQREGEVFYTRGILAASYRIFLHGAIYRMTEMY